MKKLLILFVLILFSCGEKEEVNCTCDPKPQDGPNGEKFHFLNCKVNENNDE